MQPAIRQKDEHKVLQLLLTVRGKPKSSQMEDLDKFFDFDS